MLFRSDQSDDPSENDGLSDESLADTRRVVAESDEDLFTLKDGGVQEAVEVESDDEQTKKMKVTVLDFFTALEPDLKKLGENLSLLLEFAIEIMPVISCIGVVFSFMGSL